MRIGIVGAGISGLACGEALTRQGHEVVLFDKGQRPGGRMSTRRISTSLGDTFFDHGAQYFTVRDNAFRQQVETWVSEAVAVRWPAAGNEAYVGVPGMDAPVQLMAGRQSVQWAMRVTRLEQSGHGWRIVREQSEPVEVDAAIVAIPAEQASGLLAAIAPDFAVRAGAVRSEPCWTLMLAFCEAVGTTRDCWRGTGAIGWAARNSSKPGRTGPESWVVQAGPAWSRAHIEADPKWVTAALKDELSQLLQLELPKCAGESVHRWRFARSGEDGAAAIFDPARGLGLCGDWLIGPRVEAAWRSGKLLAEQIAAAGKNGLIQEPQ